MMLLIATIVLQVHFKTGLVLYAAATSTVIFKFTLHVRRRRQERIVKRTHYHVPTIELDDERYKYD